MLQSYQRNYEYEKLTNFIDSFPKGMKYDSLGCYNKKLALQMFMEYSRKGTANPSGKFKETVYKNYPAGKMTVFNHFALMHWTYTEEWEKPR